MVFSSIPFLCFFLPLFLSVYFSVPGIGGKNAVTLLASLLFYGWGEPWFVLVLLASIAGNTLAAIGIDALDGAARRLALAAAITGNLLLLGVFKYAAFLAGAIDAQLAAALPPIALPLGISFFTFHCLSYLIDVYRRRLRANRNPIQVALYIALFPQLVAGPIVRYKTVARQLRQRRHTLGRASAGARIFIIGLAQKVLLADNAATLADAVFDHTARPTLSEAWAGLAAYTVQIYFDFAGYSSMAIGLGLILGFTLPRNFRLPYSARSITEFWRRWHMSLSAWLRDYLYIPLGGSRRGALRTYANLFTVFLLCGLWHGASWNFVLWGAWHGAFLVLERLGLGGLLRRLPPVAGWGYSLLAVMLGWVLFRARDLDAAGQIFAALAGRNGVDVRGFAVHAALNPQVLIALAAGGGIAFALPWLRQPLQRVRPPVWLAAPADAAWTLALLSLAALSVAAGTYSPFLYFRF